MVKQAAETEYEAIGRVYRMNKHFNKKTIQILIIFELCVFGLFPFFLDIKKLDIQPVDIGNRDFLPNQIRTGATFNNSANYEWWNRSWAYRFPIEINCTAIRRFWWPLDIRCNFTQILKDSNMMGYFDNTSVRVIEYDGFGDMIPYDIETLGSLRYVIPSRFIPDKYLFNAQTNAIGNLYFHLTGETLADVNRTYYVYFDVENHGSKNSAYEVLSNKNYFGMTDLAKDFQYRILAGCLNDGTANGREYILLNNQTEWSYQGLTWTNNQYCTLSAYDWNQDGQGEIGFVAFEKTEMNFSTYLSPGIMGPFNPTLIKLASPKPMSMCTGDFNKDNQVELAIGCLQQEALNIYSCQIASSSFSLDAKVAPNELDIGTLATNDLDKDGYPEIIGGITSGGPAQRFYIWEYNPGSGNYEQIFSSTDITKYQFCDITHCGDFDNDGRNEMIFAQSYNLTSNLGEIYVWECTGPNTYVYEMTFDSNLLQPVVGDILDYDNDGKYELLISDGGDGIGTIRIFEYESHATINATYERQITVDSSITPVKHPLFGDFNNDGYEEVIINGQDGRFAYYYLINDTTSYSADYGNYIGGPKGQNVMILGRRRNCDSYPDPCITIYKVEIRTADILVSLKDNDNNPVPGAKVTLLNTTTGTPLYASLISDNLGQVTYQNLSWNASTPYNVTVSLLSPNELFAVHEILIYNNTILVQDTSCTFELNLSVWTINFNITDTSDVPLNQGFILVYNDTSWDPSQIIANLSINQNGMCRFQWTNRTFYNYSIYYSNPYYTPQITRLSNDTTGIMHDGNLSSNVYFQVPLAQVRLNVIDTRGFALTGLKVSIKIHSTTLVTEMYTDASGDARDGSGRYPYYLLSSAIESNYSITMNFYGVDKLFKNALDPFDPPALSKNYTLIAGGMDLFYNVTVDSSQYQLRLTELELASDFTVAFRGSVHYSVELNATSTEPGNEFNQRINANSTWLEVREFGSGTLVATSPLNYISVGMYEFTLIPNLFSLIGSRNYYASIGATANGFGSLPTPLVYTFYVKPINTSITFQNISSQLISSVSVYWGQNFSIYVTYQDTEIDLGINDSEASCFWDFGQYTLEPVLGQSGLYSITLNSSIANQVGTKFLKFSITKTHYASYSQIPFPIHILEILTTLNGSEDFFEKTNQIIYRTENINFTFNYFDKINSLGIENAVTTLYSWRKFGLGGQLIDSGTGILIEEGLGNYIIDFNTETLDGDKYTIFISFDKPNYAPKFVFFSFEVKPIPLQATFSTNLIQSNYKIILPSNGRVEISVNLYDPYFGKFVDNANVTLVVNNLPQIFAFVNNGMYILTFNAEDYPAFIQDINLIGKIFIQKGNYTSLNQDVSFTILMDTIFPGFPTFYFILLMSFSFAIIGIPLIFKIVRYMNLPVFLKRINELKKMVEKQKQIVHINPSEDLAITYIRTKYGDRWNAMDLNFPNGNYINHSSQGEK